MGDVAGYGDFSGKGKCRFCIIRMDCPQSGIWRIHRLEFF